MFKKVKLLKITDKYRGTVFTFKSNKKTILFFLFRSIVSGLWRGVYAVTVCSEAGAHQSSVSVCLGTAGGGLPWVTGLLTPLPRPASPLPQHPAPDISKQQAGSLLQVGGGSSLAHFYFMKCCSLSALKKMLIFSRPVSYLVNQKHPGQILVKARVVPLALELSTTLLVLRPTPGLLAQSGYRSSVTLRNQLNHAAAFTWKPVVTENGILFSIRPATGAKSTAQFKCHWVWEPGSLFSEP